MAIPLCYFCHMSEIREGDDYKAVISLVSRSSYKDKVSNFRIFLVAVLLQESLVYQGIL